MNMFHRKLALTLLALSPAALLPGQVDPPTRLPKVTSTTATESGAKHERGTAESDAILANWLLVTNDNTIALARLAKDKAQGNDVKQFAQMLIDEHGQFAKNLQPFVGATTGSERTGSTRGTSDDHGDAGRQRPANASGVRQAAVAESFDHVALVRDLGKKCLDSATKMLNGKTAAEFDLAYLQLQVGAHVMSADMIEVFSTRASDRLRPTLTAGLKTVQTHLESAKALCKVYEKSATAEKGAKIGSGDGR